MRNFGNLRDYFPDNRIYQPVVTEYLAKMPALYAFRMAADQIGAIAMAQGSPLFGPPPEVTEKVGLRLIEHADQARRGFATPMDGYLAYNLYEATKKLGIEFLQDILGISGSEEELMDRLLVGGFSRGAMQNFISAIASQGPARSNDLFILTKGCWPLIFDIARKMGIAERQTNNDNLSFSDYKKIIEEENRTGNHLLYFCDPNNPLDHKFSEEEIYKFLKDLYFYCQQTGKKITILADNAYWGWCNKDFIEKHGFPSFTKVADKLLKQEGISVHEMLIEIFGLSKALGLASTGGSLVLHNSKEIVVAAHLDQSSFVGLPSYPQIMFIQESLKHALSNPEFILERSARIQSLMQFSHQIINGKFSHNSALKIKSCADQGAYIVVELDESLFNLAVPIKDKVFHIRDVTDMAIYLLEGHGVGVTPIDPRDGLPNSIRLFIDKEKSEVYEGIACLIEGIEMLSAYADDPSYDVHNHLAASLD